MPGPKVKKSLTAEERMSRRGSPNLKLFRENKESWREEYGCESYGRILDSVDFVDYTHPSVGREFIKQTGELLKKLGVDMYVELSTDVACAASRDRGDAMKIIERALAGGKFSLKPREGDYAEFEEYNRKHQI